MMLSTFLGLAADRTTSGEPAHYSNGAQALIAGVRALALGTLIGTAALCPTPTQASAGSVRTGEHAPRVFPRPAPVPDSDSSAARLQELRLKSGLTWEAIARIFGVDRRSVHLWANGRRLNSANAERLGGVLGIVRRMDQGRPGVVRDWLLAPGANGQPRIDILAEGNFNCVLEELHATPARRSAPTMPQITRRASLEHSPVELLSGTPEPPRLPKPRLIAAQALRLPKK